MFAVTDGFFPQKDLGTYAEWAEVEEGHLAPLPPRLSFAEGAGVPLVALTAWQVRGSGRARAGADGRGHSALSAWLVLVRSAAGCAGQPRSHWLPRLPCACACLPQGLDALPLPPGARILVHGGSGGVGAMAVQLAARVKRWHVTATCSPANAAYCRLGAMGWVGKLGFGWGSMEMRRTCWARGAGRCELAGASRASWAGRCV